MVIREPDQTYVAHKKCSWFTRARLSLLSLRPCPRRPAQALSDPGKPFSRQPTRPPAPAPSSSAAPRRCEPLAGPPPPASEAWSRAPAPRRFAHRTTDLAPMLRHADPCRASPCRPCRLLSALNRARPRSRALSSPGAKAAEAVPTPGMLSLESSSSFVLLLGDLLNPCFSGAQGGRRQQRKLPDVGSALWSHNAELRKMTAECVDRLGPLPPGCAPATHCCSSVFTATNVGRDAAAAIASASAASFTLDEGLDADWRQQPDLVAEFLPAPVAAARLHDALRLLLQEVQYLRAAEGPAKRNGSVRCREARSSALPRMQPGMSSRRWVHAALWHKPPGRGCPSHETSRGGLKK